MYAIINDTGVVIGLEKRELPLAELVHKDFWKNYILTDNDTLKVGDIYNDKTKKIEIIPEVPEEETPIVQAEPSQLDRIEAGLDFLAMMVE